MCNKQIFSVVLLCCIAVSTVTAAKQCKKIAFDIYLSYGFESYDGYPEFVGNLLGGRYAAPTKAISEKYPNSRFGLIEQNRRNECTSLFKGLRTLSDRPITDPSWNEGTKHGIKPSQVVGNVCYVSRQNWGSPIFDSTKRVKLILATVGATKDLLGSGSARCGNDPYPTVEQLHASLEENDVYVVLFARPRERDHYKSIFDGSNRAAVLSLNYDTFAQDMVHAVDSLALDIAQCKCSRP